MTAGRTSQKPQYDDLLEDIFGLNIRGLKTLWTTVKVPRAYYDASADADWLDKFTPSFRLWFTLVALTFFFQFFWASPNSAIIQSFALQIDSSGSLPDTLSPTAAAVTFSRWYYGLLPFSIAICLSALAFLFRAFGTKLNYIERQRRIFITVIPSALFTIFATTGFGFLTRLDWVMPLFFATLGIGFALDSLTAYRGASVKKTGRLWRSLALSASITMCSAIGAALAQFLTSVLIFVIYVQ